MARRALILILLIPLLLAAKPTRTVIAEAGGYVTVDVSAERGNFNPYEVWVANRCATYEQYLPVVYGDNFDPDPTLGQAGPFTFDGTCRVYAWEFPDNYDPISNVLTR